MRRSALLTSRKTLRKEVDMSTVIANKVGTTLLLIAVAAFFVAVLAGCSTVASSLPTMQHCAHVKYERTGTEVTIQAECTAPVGGSGL